jgi:uncharacterized protein YndB with AHSA1/START domain
MYELWKYVLYLLVALGVVAAGLWLLGGKNQEYSTDLLIEAPPDVVFPYLTDAKQLKKWAAGFVETQSLSGKPNEEGATARTVIEGENGHLEFVDTILRFDENEMLSVRSQNSAVTSTAIYRLEAKEKATLLNYTVKKSYKGIARLLIPFQKDTVQARIASEALSLKKLIEQDRNGRPGGEPRTDDAGGSESSEPP